MTWKILALSATPILVATFATIYIAATFDRYTEDLDEASEAYVKMLEDSTLSHDAKMSDLQNRLDEALAQLAAAEQRTINSGNEFEARLVSLEATAIADLESFDTEIDDMRQSVSASLADTAKENSEFRAKLQQDADDDIAERLTAAENAAQQEIASAVSQAKTTTEDIQASATDTLSDVKLKADDYLAQTRTSVQNFTAEQQELMQNFVVEQNQSQAAIAEELRNNQASFVETQKAEQQQFIEDQNAVREAMRTQSEEIAAALSEGHPMSWTAIDYTSAAEPRQESEVVKVFGRGASIETQFAVVNVTQNGLGEASVIGVAAEPVDSPILAFIELPDERFRVNRTVAVRFYRPNSSQTVEETYGLVGRIQFKEEGINCSNTKVYSYRVIDNRLEELGNGCGWFDLPSYTFTRIYILAENVQD